MRVGRKSRPYLTLDSVENVHFISRLCSEVDSQTAAVEEKAERGGRERVATALGPRHLLGVGTSAAPTLLFQHHSSAAMSLGS